MAASALGRLLPRLSRDFEGIPALFLYRSVMLREAADDVCGRDPSFAVILGGVHCVPASKAAQDKLRLHRLEIPVVFRKLLEL